MLIKLSDISIRHTALFGGGLPPTGVGGARFCLSLNSSLLTCGWGGGGGLLGGGFGGGFARTARSRLVVVRGEAFAVSAAQKSMMRDAVLILSCILVDLKDRL